MFSTCLLGMILVVNLFATKNNLKIRFNEQSFRNLLRKNAYRRFWRSGVTCIYNVKLAF